MNSDLSANTNQAISSRALWVILATSFTLMAGASMIFTLVAQLQDEFGLPTYGLGLITGTYFLGSLLAQLWFSRYADRGFVRILLVAGVLSSGISLLGFGISNQLWQFVLFRFFGGLGEGCWQPGARACLIAGKKEESGKRLGQLTSALLGGITLGPLIGTLLYNAGSLELPFFSAGVVILLMLPFALKIALPPIGKQRSSRLQKVSGQQQPSANLEDQKNSSILLLLKRKESLLALLLAVAVFFPVGVYDALWARFLEDIGASTFFVGISFLLYGLPFMIFATFGGKLADRFGAVRLSLIAIAIEIPIVAIYGQMTRPGILVTFSVIEGIVAAAAFPACQAAMARACKEDEQALGQGLAGGGSFAIGGAMAILAAPLYGSLGAGWTFGITALVILVIYIYSGVLAAQLRQQVK